MCISSVVVCLNLDVGLELGPLAFPNPFTNRLLYLTRCAARPLGFFLLLSLGHLWCLIADLANSSERPVYFSHGSEPELLRVQVRSCWNEWEREINYPHLAETTNLGPKEWNSQMKCLKKVGVSHQQPVYGGTANDPSRRTKLRLT
jgi:hypothetical protein